MATFQKLYRISDVMEQLKVSRATVYRMIHQGKLHAVKIGPNSNRITAASIEAVIGIEVPRPIAPPGKEVTKVAARLDEQPRSRQNARPTLERKRHSATTQLNTVFLLLAQYGPTVIVPIDAVCRDYFAHLTPDKLSRKISLGEIRLPLLRIEDSQRTAKGVHVMDLAAYIDAQRAAAIEECEQLARRRSNRL